MSRIVNRSESWEKAHEAFQQVNFAAWDFQTIKESLVDYLKLYFPEDFNDFIESSELVALLELFAYLGELVAYRLDLNAHENFISTAERKESVLRLAKLLSYNASRNLPARGLVKIKSISTTERVFDSNGTDLSNRTIFWNDPNNENWKEQFVVVMNRVLDQNFGSVLPSDRVQVQDVLFERYKLRNNSVNNNVLPYNVTVSNQQFPMELVSADLNDFGPLETRPEKNLNLGILYLNDGLGDSSDNTGFFFFTKQGEMQRTTSDFDGITPNQTFDLEIPNINDIDVWVNNIDPDTQEVLSDPADFDDTVREGIWVEVDVANGQNVIFNTNPNRNKYEIETLQNDQARLIFGDGKFANIPSGRFEFWTRTSANTDLVIPTTSIQNVGSSFTYQDRENKEQSFSFTFSLLTPIQNAAPSESVEHIRRVAPSVYFTQNRMVNPRDYNEFMLQDNSILKLRSINRTFAGDSKYISWHDPNEFYDNVKIFGDDGVVYFNTEETCETINASDLPAEVAPNYTNTVDALVENHVQPLLSTTAFFTRFVLEGINPQNVRTTFSSTERTNLENAIVTAINNRPTTVYLDYDPNADQWNITTSLPADHWISLESKADGNWELCYNTKRLIFHSDETQFWNTNDASVVTADTLNTNLDTVTILKANVGTSTCPLNRNYDFDVLGQVVIDKGSNVGLESIHDLYVLPDDEDEDGFPDDVDLAYLIDSNSDFVYFNRENTNSPWIFQPETTEVVNSWNNDTQDLWKREVGVEDINFAWLHRSPRLHLVDPAASNIIDTFIVTRGYYQNLTLWLNGQLTQEPEKPSPFQLRSDYGYLLESKMISDTVILHPGQIKLIFGDKAKTELQAKMKVIRSANRSLTNNQIKTSIVDAVNQFFNINNWEFGETFYFSELAAFIHSRLPVEVDSIVLVPTASTNVFGDLYEVVAKEDEIIQPDISVNEIEIVESLDADILRQSS